MLRQTVSRVRGYENKSGSGKRVELFGRSLCNVCVCLHIYAVTAAVFFNDEIDIFIASA